MLRSFRFTILDVIILTLFLGLFAAGNFRPQELRVLSKTPQRLQALGFPIHWVVYKPPVDDYVSSMAWKNWHVIGFNGVVFLGMAVGAAFVVRRWRQWVDRSKSPECNPARLLLYPIGSLATLAALVNLPVTRNLGQVASCIGILAIGVLAIGLARRNYDVLSRWATVLWGVLTMTILLYACFIVDPISFPPSSYDYPGIAIVSLLLASLIAVVGLAAQKRGVQVERV